MLDALALGGEAFAAVEPVHGAVEGPVGAAQVRRHQVGIVEVGQRCAGISISLLYCVTLQTIFFL